MIRLSDIYNFLITVLLLLLPIGAMPGTGYIDEVMFVSFLAITFGDCLINNAWKRYKLLWCIMGIMGFYLAYTLLFRNFNITKVVLLDAFIEAKPFVAFAVILNCGLSLDNLNRNLLKHLSALIATISSIEMLAGYRVQTTISGHPAFAGMSLFLAVILYLALAIDAQGKISRKDLAFSVIWLCCGLACGRSKYYGEFILTIFFIFLYRPGMLKMVKPGYVATLILLSVILIAAIWHKFSYYFILGNSDTFDPNMAASFARPALYFTGFLILLDYFPFGSGLASFATYASDVHYSTLYYEYNLDKVWGLSPTYSEFICDAYYPSLAQFGVVGLILFICFWRYIYNITLRFIHINAALYRNYFVIGTLLICFVLIECTTGTGFSTAPGFMAMIILGLICRKAIDVSTQATDNTIPLEKNEKTKRITI
ncbi:hypothetical protein [uncultured Muribaculum sp.]|uniref:hypothetical protein n=1 Tax=uncultured Muribaculum sp. TaxID=1918613 RepID=UPI0025DD1ECD|nr:hypothetical protein [uncultured Muribaculum sp.]